MSDAREHAAIDATLRAAGVSSTIASMTDLTGGCIHRVHALTLADGRRLVAKTNNASALPLFAEEQAGLKALAATRTVIVPEPLLSLAHGDCAVLLMTHVDPPARSNVERDSIWRNFGDDLAAMHLAALSPELARGYGFTIDNHLGATLQPNHWCSDWVEFNIENRFNHQLRLARSRGLLDSAEAKRIETMVSGLDRILLKHSRPSLLHGDLWSGNALPTSAKIKRAGPFIRLTCAVIDPAPYVGDALADIAMMQLFAGFDSVCFESWAEATGVDLSDTDATRRIAVYQLYHVLNHVNLFGKGYVGQAMSLLARIDGR